MMKRWLHYNDEVERWGGCYDGQQMKEHLQGLGGPGKEPVVRSLQTIPKISQWNEVTVQDKGFND